MAVNTVVQLRDAYYGAEYDQSTETQQNKHVPADQYYGDASPDDVAEELIDKWNENLWLADLDDDEEESSSAQRG